MPGLSHIKGPMVQSVVLDVQMFKWAEIISLENLFTNRIAGDQQSSSGIHVRLRDPTDKKVRHIAWLLEGATEVEWRFEINIVSLSYLGRMGPMARWMGSVAGPSSGVVTQRVAGPCL